MTLETRQATGAAAADRLGAARLTLVRRSAPDADTEPLLALDGITKCWRAARRPVLDDVGLELGPGTLAWIGGRNGVGKTTLLRIVAGLILPDSGRATVRGITVREDRTRYQRLVALLPAGDRGLYARLTVRHHLKFWARIAMLEAERLDYAAERALDTFGLRELADRRVDRLSMGQRQRLRIAMTFLPSPELVLLDEPLTSLDTPGVELLGEAIERVRRRGGAVLWCSPNEEPLAGAFTTRWILDGGRLASA